MEDIALLLSPSIHLRNQIDRIWLGDVCFHSTSIADQAHINSGNSLQPIAEPVNIQAAALYPNLGDYRHGSSSTLPDAIVPQVCDSIN